MSNRPLFQNADEQEAAYAPQQLPEGTEGHRDAAVDDRDRGTDEVLDTDRVPAAGAGLLGQTTGASSGVVGGSPSAIGPSVGSAAPEDETRGPGVTDDARDF